MAKKATSTKSCSKKTAGTHASPAKKAETRAVKNAKTAEIITENACPENTEIPEANTMKILYVSPEAVPFAGTGGLGDVGGSLPKSLNRIPGVECRLIMPLYKAVKQEFRDRMKFLGCKDIPVAWRNKYMGVFMLETDEMTVYFIDNEEYFKRDNLYGYFDDCERYAFFSRAVFESLQFTGYYPNIIHANDWQTSLVPVYQDCIYQMNIRTVFTIHNIEYQGQYGFDTLYDVIGLPNGAEHLIEFNSGVNLLKGGITTANMVNTVSPTYANQLKDPYYAHGLENIISEHSYKLTGLLNGIDTVLYDPSTDPYIPKNYSKDDVSGKAECKRALQESLYLPVKDNVPMITMISRLVAHKGVDLITATIDNFLNQYDIQFVLLGTGDGQYENFFRQLESRHHDKVRSMIMFNRELSHQIYAAGDILLMPSKSEPCGLAQMIGCRYGNVPLVRATGGLNDSIKDCRMGDGNGFVFTHFDTESFASTLRGAIKLYYDQENWNNLVKFDLGLDFSWDKSAEEYVKMYKNIL